MYMPPNMTMKKGSEKITKNDILQSRFLINIIIMLYFVTRNFYILILLYVKNLMSDLLSVLFIAANKLEVAKYNVYAKFEDDGYSNL